MNSLHQTQHKIRRVVVTGGLGFIGAVLCRRLLAEGAHVLVIDNQLFGRRRVALPPHPLLTVTRMDIRDRAKVMYAFGRFRPDAVFHLAALAFIPKCMEDPAAAIDIHLHGTMNVIDAARAVSVRHFQFASSAAVYSPNVVLLSEARTPTCPPPDIYGITKLAGELFCERFQKETHAHVVITRFFNVYGPNHTNAFLIPSICRQIRAGKKTLHLGNLTVARDYIHVDDVVDAVLLLMRRTNGLVIANVGSGKKTTVRKLVALCIKIAGRNIRVVSEKKLRRPKATDRPAWRADLRRIQSLIRWKPRHTLRQGLEELILGKSYQRLSSRTIKGSHR